MTYKGYRITRIRSGTLRWQAKAGMVALRAKTKPEVLRMVDAAIESRAKYARTGHHTHLLNPGSKRDQYHSIRPGDTVTFSRHHGGTGKGRVVMHGPAGWVVNAGGAHGTPTIVDERNFISVKKGARKTWLNPRHCTYRRKSSAIRRKVKRNHKRVKYTRRKRSGRRGKR